MKALTICQPYAHLITIGEKRVENRSWPTSYRGRLAIHAGKSREWMDEDDLKVYPDMVFGAVVAVADLVDCVRYDHIQDHQKKYPWLGEHHHASGPWCFVLADVKRLEKPIPWRGAQGFFEIPDGEISRVATAK
jgi:hypothetical protein